MNDSIWIRADIIQYDKTKFLAMFSDGDFPIWLADLFEDNRIVKMRPLS